MFVALNNLVIVLISHHMYVNMVPFLLSYCCVVIVTA
jgi:hypothetical protein